MLEMNPFIHDPHTITATVVVAEHIALIVA